jgi:hypothetical protein
LYWGATMKTARLLVIVVGVLLPYLARIPGMAVNGVGWFTSYLGGGLAGVAFIGAFNAVCWVSILAATCTYRHARSVWFPAVLGFALPAIVHASVDLAADAQAAIVLVFIPLYSLPLVFIGWLIGRWYDRKISR